MAEFFAISRVGTGTSDELAALAGRIGVLLERHERPAPALSACLDDLLGAVYSLFYANRHEYADRPAKSLTGPDMKNVIVRAKQMADGKVREDGKWTAGFYFNNALFRLAAVYHRVLKVLTHKEATDLRVQDLLPFANDSFKVVKNRQWTNLNIHKIHRQVNELKHTAQGIYRGRDVRFEEAKAGVNELLVLIEALA
jgi:hypothetical protein